MKRIFIFLGLVCALNAHAWDSTGHMLVAQIARERMSTQAIARVDALAAKLDHKSAPYNGVSIAVWPDDIKDKDFPSKHQGQFRKWHYIDMGCAAGDPDLRTERPPLSLKDGDVVSAITHCVELIRAGKTDEDVPSEEVALALLMHFVGDVHQPLHATSRYNSSGKGDAGGNAVTVANLADTPWGKNLHTFWDESYRRFYEDGQVKAMPGLNPVNVIDSAEMKEWLKRLSTIEVKPSLAFDVKKWTLETHELGCIHGYGKLREPYGARDISLREDYVNESVRIARRQIVVAGYRLGALLEDLYGR